MNSGKKNSINFIRKTLGSLVIFSILLSSAGSFPSKVLAWHGDWSFTESCNTEGTVDVSAIYTPSDSLGGTVQYTSSHTSLKIGDVVTVNLVEDSNQNSSYTVANINNCGQVNTPPVITITGLNPVEVILGNSYLDLGATAQDLEDGDITSNIVVVSNVNTNATGTYAVSYNVADSKGLTAEEKIRVVNVISTTTPSTPVPTPTNAGKITFCLVLANTQNEIATDSSGLPEGTFTINLGITTGDIASSTNLELKSWDSSTFTPNKTVISSVNDSDCITYDNLTNGIYTYSEVSTTGPAWISSLYNDQDSQTITTISDFFAYNTLTNTNSDGYIILDDTRNERALYILSKYNSASQCLLPEVTSTLTTSTVVGTPFTYTLTSSSTTDTLAFGTSTLPSWLTLATSTNTISGTATTTGTYNVGLDATNSCGLTSKTLVITVNPVSTGGGGGGGGPMADIEVTKSSDKSTANVGDTVTYTIKVINKGPNNATGVNLSDTLPSTLTFVSSTSTLGSYATSTGIWSVGDLVNNASTTLNLVATINAGTEGQKISNTAVASSTLSDPTSTNNSSTSEINVNAPVPVSGGGGGGGGGSTIPANGPIVGLIGGVSSGPIVSSAPTSPSAPTSCYYLYDYLRKDFNNNPVEVKKLQVFLRDLEGFKDVQVTGVYDDQTIVALDAFQERYMEDILTPWGHTEATSYTYILTKKKVNEIYCKIAFPVTALEQIEIDSYRTFLQGLKDSGALLPDGTISPVNPSDSKDPIILEGQVGVGSGDENSNGSLGALAGGISSTTAKFVSNLTANVISSAKKFATSLLSSFILPFKSIFDKSTQCIDNYLGFSWLNLVLISIIILISYLWYREHINNKKIEELNKEIDIE